jgi:hypothetical protein
MSRTHDVTISAFDLDRLEAELAAVTEQRDRLLAEREQWRMSSVCRELTEQRDRLAEELKEAQNAIEMMLRDSSCRRIPAYTEEQLAAVKGGNDD